MIWYENIAAFHRQNIHNSYSASNLTMYAQLEDLIYLCGPLTEDVVLKTLQARFYSGRFYTNIGPVLLVVNPYTEQPKPKALTFDSKPCPQIYNIVKSATQQLSETGMSQTLVLNGISGSGKSHTSMLLLRQLFDVAGGGCETDAFKHLMAAFTVLRSMGNAATPTNSESSRMGYYIESHVTDGAIFKTKTHCYFLDQSRITHLCPKNRNYHIFYQILAGLSQEERVKYHLQGYFPHNLNYLSNGELPSNEEEDKTRFEAWKSSLSVLGIPFTDIMRILSAILLLGNIHFIEGPGLELDVKGNNEMKAVAALLGISGVSLYRGLTTRTRKVRGQTFKSTLDVDTANHTKYSLARSIYSRTVAAIAKRANSSKRPPSNSAVSIEGSGHDVTESSTPSLNGSMTRGHPQRSSAMSRTSSIMLPPSSKLTPSGFIGILDMFGFENCQNNQLEQLCINLCSETLQHYYLTHIFKITEESCIEECIHSDMDINYFDNVPIIEIISSQRTGILSQLDSECILQKTNVDTYLQKVRVQHGRNKFFFEDQTQSSEGTFGINHYTDKVIYNATDFFVTNRDSLADDVVWAFDKQNCNFGFATHLFGHELRSLQESHGPKGGHFKISSSPNPMDSKSEQKATLSQDFHSKLDNLLKTLVHTKPHFIRCLKSNKNAEKEIFDREVLVAQIRSEQVLETVHLMAGGFPHRLKYKAFSTRYRLLIKAKLLTSMEKAYDETKLILDHYLQAMDDSLLPYASAHWALGKKHIFLSESARQQFDLLREEKRKKLATVIQAYWRRRVCVKKWPTLKRQLDLRKRSKGPPRYKRTRHNSIVDKQDIFAAMNKEQVLLEKTCKLYGLDMDNPPPVPTSRRYTVQGNMKMCFPQIRVMRQNYPEYGNRGEILVKGQEVKVVGTSSKRGYLLVEYGKSTIHVPYQLTTIRSSSNTHLPGMDV